MSKNKSKSNKQHRKIIRWTLIILLWTFASAAFLSFISETILRSVNLTLAFILLIIMIFMNLLSDLIGVAVTACLEVPFNAMASKKIKGASQALNLIKNADRVANFCQDVIGDITGILSGSLGATIIVVILFKNPGLNQFLMSMLMISTISAVTVAGKAVAKNMALKHSVTIISKIGIFIYYITYFFKRKKNKIL